MPELIRNLNVSAEGHLGKIVGVSDRPNIYRVQFQFKVCDIHSDHLFVQGNTLTNYLRSRIGSWQDILVAWSNEADYEKASLLKKQVTDLLAQFEFGKAIDLFESTPQRLWPRDDFQNEYEAAKALSAKKLRIDELRKTVLGILESNYLDAHRFLKAQYADLIGETDLQKQAMAFVSQWFRGNAPNDLSLTGQLPDDEQCKAIAYAHGNCQVVARAGSGKTSTLVNRAFFLQKHCGVKPSEMMLLAFNKKAAEVMEERLSKLLDSEPPFVMTFHALAHSLIHPDQNLIHDSSDGRNLALSRFVQDVINNRLRDPTFTGRIRKVMVAQFQEDWDRIEQGGYDLPPEKMLEYRRSLQRETLRGEFVKSHGEKVIANFLFEHQVPYLYEPLERGRLINYHPDFLITRGDRTGVAIEYFGMVGDPDYDEMSKEKRLYWQSKTGWVLFELTPVDIRQKGLERLQAELEGAGFEFRRMTEMEIWHQISKRAIDRFSMVTRSFIARCRKQGLTPETLQQEIGRHKTKWQVEADFLDIMVLIYADYLERLAVVGNEDFDGLMQRAAQAVSEGKTMFSRNKAKQYGDLANLRFMLIDEYQDFSKLFHSMVEAIRRRNPNLQLFCVGDDWQAINGFAGSDLEYYENFSRYFPDSERLHISTNYRSAAGIVAVGNAVMAGRDSYGKPAVAHLRAAGNIWLADLNEFSPSPAEDARHGTDRITPMVLRLAAQALSKDKDIVLLSRTNNPPGYINYKAFQGSEGNTQATGIERFRNLVRTFFSQDQRHKIKASTTHKFKGLQGSVVVVLDAVTGCYPLIHQDWIFLRLLGESIDMITDESRRLFYVALTRAVDTLVIFTEKNKKSPFLEEVESRIRLSPLFWGAFPPVAAKSDRLLVMVGNHLWESRRDSDPTCNIKLLLKQERYDYRKVNNWPCWVKNFPVDGFSIQQLQATSWSASAVGVEVRVLDEQDNLVGNYRIDAGVWIELMPLSASG